MNIYAYCLVCDELKIMEKEYFKAYEFCNKCKEMTPHRDSLIPEEDK